MNSFIKGLFALIGGVLLIPVGVVVVGLLIVTLIGGYIGALVTLWEWMWIVIGGVALIFVVNWIIKIIDHYR